MKKVNNENFLDKIPVRKAGIEWSVDEDGKVTLQMENKGIANRIAQKLLKKPKISYIHLDENGSFIWPLLDGDKILIGLTSKNDFYLDFASEENLSTS